MQKVKLGYNNAAKTYICVIRNCMDLTLQNRVSLLTDFHNEKSSSGCLDSSEVSNYM